MKCKICSSINTLKFLSLGHQPPSDAFLTKEQLNKSETHYPLDVYFCEDCNLVQLGHTINPKELFNEDFPYTTGTSGELKKNFSELTEKLTEKFNLTDKDLVIDIGSNDGTLLKGYIKHNIKILGIEPTGTADLAIKMGIPTIKKFFNEDTANEVLKNYGKTRVITATNVFAHVDELHGFIRGINNLLTKKGVFISESHHLLNLIVKIQYDSIYHEHLRYYSLKPLIHLFNLHNMDVFDAELITTHGGSIRVYACKKGEYKISESVKEIINLEEKSGLYSKKTFEDYKIKVEENKKELKELLRRIKEGGNNIVGIGAPAKGNTLLNYCHINTDLLNYLAEKSELKIKQYSPGMHIPVVDESELFNEQPEYALLLSWNLKEIIIPKIRANGYKGKIIIPIPKPSIIE